MSGAFAIIAVVGVAGTALAVAGHYLAVGARRARAGAPAARGGLWSRLVYAATALSFLVLAVTGFTPAVVWQTRLGGYWLMVHTVFGAVFGVCLTLLVLTWAGERRVGAAARAAFWLVATLGLGSLMTMMLGTVPWFGQEGMAVLFELHRWTGVVLTMAMIVHGYLRVLARRAAPPARVSAGGRSAAAEASGQSRAVS